MLEWTNEASHEVLVKASFTGKLPGDARIGLDAETGYLYSSAPYSEVPQSINFVLPLSTPT
jgi:hypothetical protein